MRSTRRALAGLTGLALSLSLAGCGIFGGGGEEPGDLQVYSARHYDLEKAFAEFEEETGLKVDFLFAEDADLLQRLSAEGEKSPADLFLTVDAGNLWAAEEAGVLAPVDSPALNQAVPARYRDSDGTWYGLARRERTLVYNPDNVDPAEFDTENSYAGLADPKWEGRLCMRDAAEAYTQSLVAALMAQYGKAETRAMVEGWIANDVDVMGNDILLLEAVDAGTCDVALVNHYYLARETAANPDMNVELFWASQDGDGVMENLSGGGVVASSDNPEQARQLLEWLATDGQEAFVGDNHEYPVNPEVPADEVVAQYGDFTTMPVDAEAYGELNAEALAMLDDLGYE
jgi:iron(III) transport system substrate-binding protein